MVGEKTQTDVPPEARCLDCGYLLRDLPEHRCPECGRAFDPRDPGTVRVGDLRDRCARVLMQPVGQPVHLLAYGSALAIAWGEAWLAGGFYVTMVGIIIAATYFAYRALRYCLQVMIARIYGWPRTRASCRTRPVAVLGVVVALAILDVPRFTMYWLHRPLLDRYVRHVHAELPAIETDDAFWGWVGLMCFPSVRVEANRIYIRIDLRAEFWITERAGRYHYEARWRRWDLYRAIWEKFTE